MDAHRPQTEGGVPPPSVNHRLHPRVPLGTRALVNQPTLWPEPFEVVAENLSLGGAYFNSGHLFTPYDFFHCRMMLPGSGAIAGREVRLSAVVVRVDEAQWPDEGRCGVGAFFVGLDERDEEAIQGYVQEVRMAGRSPIP
jgi:PilZ domain-containing protein